MSTWYANYSSRLDKRSQCHTSSLKFWWTTIVIKVKLITVTYRIVHYVRYKWCANEQSMIALGSLIFLLDYSSVYSHSWIQRVFYNGCLRLLKFVRISGVYVHMGIRCSKLLVLTEELLMALWIVNNNTKSVFCIIKWMQYKDTFQQAFLIIYLMCFIIYLLFTWYISVSFSFEKYTKRCGYPWLMADSEVNRLKTGAFTFRFKTLPPSSCLSHLTLLVSHLSLRGKLNLICDVDVCVGLFFLVPLTQGFISHPPTPAIY